MDFDCQTQLSNKAILEKSVSHWQY